MSLGEMFHGDYVDRHMRRKISALIDGGWAEDLLSTKSQLEQQKWTTLITKQKVLRIAWYGEKVEQNFCLKILHPYHPGFLIFF